MLRTGCCILDHHPEPAADSLSTADVHITVLLLSVDQNQHIWREREGGREGGRERGRERGREGGREREREGGRERGREGEREGGREGGRGKCHLLMLQVVYPSGQTSGHRTQLVLICR